MKHNHKLLLNPKSRRLSPESESKCMGVFISQNALQGLIVVSSRAAAKESPTLSSRRKIARRDRETKAEHTGLQSADDTTADRAIRPTQEPRVAKPSKQCLNEATQCPHPQLHTDRKRT